MNLRDQHLAWLRDNPRPTRRYFEKTEDYDAAVDAWLEAQLDFGGYASWLEVNQPPSMLGMIERYGGYSNIPAAAWKEYEADWRHWNLMRKHRSG